MPPHRKWRVGAYLRTMRTSKLPPCALWGQSGILDISFGFVRRNGMRFAKTQVITLANQKGGCGKTSTTVSMAAAFIELGYTVCVLDTDPQCNATDTFGITQDQLKREGGFTLADIFLSKKSAADCLQEFGERFSGRLRVVPGHPGLNTVSPRLEADIQAQIANEGEFDP